MQPGRKLLAAEPAPTMLVSPPADFAASCFAGPRSHRPDRAGHRGECPDLDGCCDWPTGRHVRRHRQLFVAVDRFADRAE